MPAAARLGDNAQVAADAHGCPACPHPAVGPITVGSPNVNINKKPAGRLDDIGAHAVCCGANNFTIVKGSPTVYVNNKPLARRGDKTKHCGGTGPIIAGSPDVLIDDGAASAAALAAIKAAKARKIAHAESQKNQKGTAKKATDKNPGKSATGHKGGGDLSRESAAEKKGAARKAGSGGDSGAGTGAAPAKPAKKTKSGKELSGAHWVSRFPNSRSVGDLNDDFRPKVQAFLAALHTAGASVSIATTYRPPERAFLMHYSPLVAKGSVAPDSVPTKAGVEIEWDHGSRAASETAARAMANGYGLAFPAALNSRHTAGAAIDMNISWRGTLEIVDGNGKTVSIGAPRNGVFNSKLHAVGASYGVYKLLRDKPHWSDNGH